MFWLDNAPARIRSTAVLRFRDGGATIRMSSFTGERENASGKGWRKISKPPLSSPQAFGGRTRVVCHTEWARGWEGGHGYGGRPRIRRGFGAEEKCVVFSTDC